ncbi:AaceriAAR133Wp [[Ashbya] aceris (nom. inval.)]|nr:AaceriAAR133Wp [[Ashbya] aceris (nom. inval.)]
MGEIESSLRALSICDDEELVDITEHVRQLASQLQAETIVKLADFDLFEGTHALEINNRKLDSVLLELTAAEEGFDCEQAYGAGAEEQLGYVTGTVERLSRSLVDWLHDYQSLPTTVLSCRYVEHLSQRHRAEAGLAASRLATGSELYDCVLSSCVFATLAWVNFVGNLLRAGVVYEEEDLNCNTMGLDVLADVAVADVLAELAAARGLLEQKYAGGERLLLLVRLFECLLKVPNYRPLAEQEPSDDVEPMHELIRIAAELARGPCAAEAPPGTFSQGIQKRLSNQFPPKQLYEPVGHEFQAYQTMAEDILKVLDVRHATSVIEVRQSAWFFNRCSQRHVVARALFPLYLMRDDQSIIGIYSFADFTHQTLLNFSCCGTELDRRLSDPVDDGSLKDLDPFYQEISGILFEWYQNMSQNVCRYRQGYNRQLLLWDSLQAKLEPFENKLADEGITDLVSELDNAPLMPINSWVYFMKLSAMLEFLLKGFDLEVYKPWEFFTIYWYAYYLSHHLESCLKRVHSFAEQRIASIHAMNKKIKKIKAGPKKENLRAAYQYQAQNVLPQLRLNVSFLDYLLADCAVTKSLALAQTFQFGILKSYGAVSNSNPGASTFSSDRFLHQLRFKTFSSIGVPDLPSYETFESSLDAFTISGPGLSMKLKTSLQLMNNELETSRNALRSILKEVEAASAGPVYGLFTGTRLVTDSAKQWYTSLDKTVDALASNGRRIEAALGAAHSVRETEQKVELVYPRESCRYFPILQLHNSSDK